MTSAREAVNPEGPSAQYALAGVEAPRRGPVMGRRCAVAADHPLVTLTAMNVLQSGGNAIDAVIAAAAVNVVTKPTATHLGGDGLALIWHRRTGQVECLNAGGRAPGHATLDLFPEGIPRNGPRSCGVPGFVDSILELHQRYGSKPWAALLAPAISFCEDGFPVSLHLSGAMAALQPDAPAGLREMFLDNGRPYRMGETFRQPRLGESLAAVASDGRDGFYSGKVGKAIAEAMVKAGGLIDLDDLAEPTGKWADPIVTSYRGHTIYEQAMPTQGLIVLEALNIVENFPLAEWGLRSADTAHVMIEATRRSFADCGRYAADPEWEDVPLDMLLSREHAASHAAAIDMKRIGVASDAPSTSDTTSFVVADENMAVCFIQSVFAAWGSRFAIPEVGVLMNNRLSGFHADPKSPNRLEPRKRTVHTLNNFLVVKDGRLVIGGGTPGADGQPQTNLQVIAGVLDWGLDLQAAVDTPRWILARDGHLTLENRAAPGVAEEPQARGHDVNVVGPWSARAASQVISSLDDGGWAVASDLRGEGLALAL
jgi:gamma-glutamyltranspeptidase/glutathione hydrolase